MAEVMRITGANTIDFLGTTYPLEREGLRSFKGMNTPLPRRDILRYLNTLPREIWEPMLRFGMSVWTIPITIQADSHTLLEQARQDLTEVFEETKLYWGSNGGRGTLANMEYKLDGAVATSYKQVYWGEVDDSEARATIGGLVRYILENVQIRLYCYPTWHPNSVTNLVNAVTIYNHDDGDASHDNYVDIAAASILGDVEALVKLKIKYGGGPTANLFSCMGARRSRGTVSNLVHIHEAEDFGTKSNWASSIDATCSGGNKVSDSAAVSEYVEKTLSLDAQDDCGDFYCYARLKTDDIINTKFRVGHKFTGAKSFFYLDWVYPDVASKWQWVNLGVLRLDILVQMAPAIPTIRIEYEKGATDLAELDYIMLMPSDEAVFYYSIREKVQVWDAVPDAIINEADDFPYISLEVGGNQGPDMDFRGSLTLRPNVANRIYFVVQAYDGTDVLHDVHNGADSQFNITIDYLPQYLSPIK